MRIRMGRDPENDVVLSHPLVSRFHAEVQGSGPDCVLVDLDSTSGTFLNEDRVHRSSALGAGDSIRLGPCELQFDGSSVRPLHGAAGCRVDVVGVGHTVGGSKVLLHPMSLTIQPDEFVALVGVSGAGKTTLMNALCGFHPPTRGTVLLDGHDFYETLETWRGCLGFVPQEDIIHKELTIERALHFAACLRMPWDTTAVERSHRIDGVLQDLRLEEHRTTRISLLSGGQRKRASLAVELLTQPRVFFLDEPTTGLDPGMETELMRIFRGLADKGHTMVVVTHATRNIMLCDKVIFLTDGGYLAFFGTPTEALEYFETSEFAEIYLRLQYEKSPEEWGRLFEQRQRRDEASQPTPSQPTRSSEGRQRRGHAGGLAPMPRQLGILTLRYAEILRADRGLLTLLLGSAFVIAMLSLLLFPDPDMIRHFVFGDYKGPEDRGVTVIYRLAVARQVAYYLITAVIFFGVNNGIREIARERAIYRRERTVGIGVAPYLLSKILVLSCVCLLQVAVLETVVCLHLHLPGASSDLYLHLFALLFAGGLAATSLGLAFSSGAANENKAASGLPLLVLPQFFLTGQFPELSPGTQWVAKLGLSKWMYDGIQDLLQFSRIFPSRATVPDPVLRLMDHALQYGNDGMGLSFARQVALRQLDSWIQEGQNLVSPPGFSLISQVLVLVGFCCFFLVLARLLLEWRDRVRM